MYLLHWHHRFDDCSDLDEIHARWHETVRQWHFNPGYETPEYRDALLSFVATSRLPAALKLAALLTCVSGFDIDVRLALGVLDNVDDETATAWPAPFADAAALLGPCPSFVVHDPALGNFALGRLAALRDVQHLNREDQAHWRAVFWDAYLELGCRWADPDALTLALENGASLAKIAPLGLTALAEGIHSPALDAPYYTEGRSNADYLKLIDYLRDGGLDLGRESTTMLAAAARVDNTEMLEGLIARGADLSAAGREALVSAASCAAHDAVQWLIARGVNSTADLTAALLAGVKTLDETLIELLLDAGADIHAADEQPLCTAFAAQPFELYNGETAFIAQRAEIIALLASRGADLAHARLGAALQEAKLGQAVLAAVLETPALPPSSRAALTILTAHTVGAPNA